MSDDHAIYPTHDCFTDAMQLLQEAIDAGGAAHVRVVHAIAVAPAAGCGLLAGQRFAHAWLEQNTPKGVEALQRGIWHGHLVTYGVFARELEAELKVERSWRYTADEALGLNLLFHHFGPWDPALQDLVRRGTRCRDCGAVPEHPTADCAGCASAPAGSR